MCLLFQPHSPCSIHSFISPSLWLSSYQSRIYLYQFRLYPEASDQVLPSQSSYHLTTTQLHTPHSLLNKTLKILLKTSFPTSSKHHLHQNSPATTSSWILIEFTSKEPFFAVSDNAGFIYNSGFHPI
jgi:hypothetical protein